MSDILCVTSRQLCREDFLARLERIAAARPARIVLREKDLSPAAYRALAGQVLEICRRRGVPCILHAFPDIAEELGAESWVSFSCRDGSRIHEGDLLRGCAAELEKAYPHLRMIGVNCTPPQFVEHLIGELKAGTSLPIAVYPNSGETYDPATKTWHGSRDGLAFGDYARRWMRAGASAVGGCCRTVDSHIREVVKARELFRKLG